ncbi:MAG: NAD(P)-binding protein [Methanosphaera sp.]|nr:NAD(P)-binding protein [Methanosphaera sp.]
MYDAIIVGAGISGICAANMLAQLDYKVLLIEKENYVGGMCHEKRESNGVLVPLCGPHILSTDNKEVYDHLSKYTSWKSNKSHKVVCKINNTEGIPIPFNLISIEKSLINVNITDVMMELSDNGYKINDRLTLRQLEDIDSTVIGHLTYYLLKYSESYYKKCYGKDALEVLRYENPVLFNYSYDCRYDDKKYQAIPSDGYNELFNRMLNNKNITLKLDTDYKDILRVDHENGQVYYEDKLYENKLIITSRVDEFFDYEYGILPYTTMTYLNENIDEEFFQSSSIIEYPDEYSFMRIIEYKHITREDIDSTTIQFEYPDKYYPDKTTPYSPLPTKKNRYTYDKYKKLMDKYDKFYFTGRLCEYRNISIDEALSSTIQLINDNFRINKDDSEA